MQTNYLKGSYWNSHTEEEADSFFDFYFFCSPVVLIMLLGVAVAAAKMLGVLPAVAALPVGGVPTVLTDRLPGGGFFTGTITLL